MPCCSVQYCTNRSNRSTNPATKNIKYFMFPKELDIRQQWYNACQKSDKQLKVEHARICEIHFTESCFEMQWTQKRKGKENSAQICRLKKGSIPTENLNLVRKERILLNPRIKNTGRNRLPTYKDLVNTSTDRERNLQMDERETSHNFQEMYYSLLQHIKYNEQEKANLQQEVTDLKKKLAEESNTLQKLRTDKQEEKDKYHAILQKVFTKGQIKRLLNPNQIRIQWSSDDITSALKLHCVSSKAYRYLREQKNIPLPCESTLQVWCSNFHISPGILYEVLAIMKDKGQDLSVAEKVTVLTFDEISIFKILDLERKEQKVYGPHKLCQFVMARGLFSNWRQPIFYAYDQPMTKDLLLNIIKQLYTIDYNVVAVTCDMGPTNMRVWKELNIGVNIPISGREEKRIKFEQKQCYIHHPSDSTMKVFFFADVSHLIKLVRNNFLDHGFYVDGEFINKVCLEELLSLNKHDLKIAYTLTKTHLDVWGSKRQNVKLATQLFSNLNAKSLDWCGCNGLLVSKNWRKTSEVIQTCNDWFDVFNSHVKYGSHSGLRGYGVELHDQDKILDNMTRLVSEMRVGKKSSLMQFQKGILLSNESLKELFKYTKEKFTSDTFQIQYIITRRLNQDILENFFSRIRAMGVTHGHPTPVQLRYRLKLYILGQHFGHVISKQENTEGDATSTPLINLQDTLRNESQMLHVLQKMVDDEPDLTAEKELFLAEEEMSNYIDEYVDEKIVEEEEKALANMENERKGWGVATALVTPLP